MTQKVYPNKNNATSTVIYQDNTILKIKEKLLPWYAEFNKIKSNNFCLYAILSNFPNFFEMNPQD